jgi:hypothetical protein
MPTASRLLRNSSKPRFEFGNASVGTIARDTDVRIGANWQRILDPLSPIFGRRHRSDDRRLYVAVLHEGTWTIAPILFVEQVGIAQ